jgi:dihydropteroate synthase
MSDIQAFYGGYKVGDGFDPLIVGAINLSPESFYKPSIAVDMKTMIEKIEAMIDAGVQVIDVGALSSRPLEIYGGGLHTEQEEIERVQQFLPSIIELSDDHNIPISIDTQSSVVAQIAIDYGSAIVNDISGLKRDPNMAEVVADGNVDLVIMASDENPGDVCKMDDVLRVLNDSLDIAKDAGIQKDRIVIDPAFGSWNNKSSDCDYNLLQEFTRLRELGLPVYIGVSRKSTINTLGGGELPEERLAGSLILAHWLVERGAHIIRTHDVKDTINALNVSNSLRSF